MKTNIGKFLVRQLFVLLIVLWSAESVFAAEPGKVQVNVSESVTLSINNVAKMAIADPTIADVVLLSENEISVIGKKVGATTLTVTHPGNLPSEIYRVEVGGTSSAALIRSLIPELPSVSVKEVGDVVILDGQVQDELQVQRVLQIAEGCKVRVVNLIEVKSPRQIAIRIRVAEVNSDSAKRVGFKWLGPAGEVQYAMAFAGTGTETLDVLHGLIQPKSVSGTTPTSIGDTRPSVDVILQLLVDNNLARLLAEPTLLTKSGSEASFLVGEERPIVQQLPNSVTVDYKKIGVQMKVKPVADSQNRITTTIHAEVSQVTGLTPGLEIPIIGTKMADTTLQVRDGQTIVIGGLLENNMSRDSLRKVPWLGDIPLFGYLFRHRERTVQQREVLFFMTPQIVKDVDAATAGAARSPFMQQWNGQKSNEKVLEIPKRDEPGMSLKGAPEEPKQPEPATKAPSTNFGPSKTGAR